MMPDAITIEWEEGRKPFKSDSGRWTWKRKRTINKYTLEVDPKTGHERREWDYKVIGYYRPYLKTVIACIIILILIVIL